MVRNRRDDDSLVRMIGRKSLESLTDVVIAVIGDTLKDRIARAVLVGLISSFGHYAMSLSDDQKTPEQHPISQQKDNAP